MTTMKDLFSTSEAAEYLGMTVRGVWYHIRCGHLTPAKIGKTLVFTRGQLEQFQLTRRPAGRPKTKEA